MAVAEAFVTPDVLRWARQQAGYAIDEADRWFGGRRAKVEAWEHGDAHPTFAQLRTLAKRYDRPLADFFRDTPPSEPPLPADFRAAPHDDPRQMGLLRKAVRELQDLRDAAGELSAFGEEPPPRWRVDGNIDEPVGMVAARVRAALGVSPKEQAGWRDSDQAWAGWRRAVERTGALVFVLSGYAAETFGGIALPGKPYPVIGINGKDHTERKVFTLLHEVVHLALRQAAITDAADGAGDSADGAVEVFCNAVAAEVLMPVTAVRVHALVLQHQPRAPWLNDEIRALASDFRVSQQALYRRLVTMELASIEAYRRWVDARPQIHRGEGGGNFYNTFLHHTSDAYLHLVFNAYHTRKINLTNVCDLLGHGVVVVKQIERRFVERAQGGSL